MRMAISGKEKWDAYKEAELAALRPVLARHRLTLEEEQPHIAGERYLMQAVTTESGRKLILLARTEDQMRVVIKATRDAGGARELRRERSSRSLIRKIRFAYEVFHTPEETAFFSEDGFTVSIQRFIDQASPFLDRPLKEQFALALSAFKAQEGAHATTYAHLRDIQKRFETMDSADYLMSFAEFTLRTSAELGNADLKTLLLEAGAFLEEGRGTIEQYTGFLTHTDFVPHNFRVVGSDIYLLDHSSIRFGNKHEGWARFLNFMALHNPELEQALTDYVRLNRSPEELHSLTLMRVYRLGEIIWYYTRTLSKSTGDLQTLNRARISFWARMLDAVLNGERLRDEELLAYRALRDRLRSEDEKRRQRDLH